MKSLSLQVASLLLLGAAISDAAEPEITPPAKQDDGGVQQWRNLEGKEINAHFLKVEGNQLILSNKLGRHSTPLAGLTSESRAQAKQMSGIIDVFQPVRRGRFKMGSPSDQPGREPNETHHEVVTSEFMMKATEVTWTEWNAVRSFAETSGYIDISTGNNGARGSDADLNPVVGITWWDAVKWCNLKSQLESREPVYYTSPKCGPKSIFKYGTATIHVNWRAKGYRLPTEAEWEFACRTRDSSWEFHNGSIKETGTARDMNLEDAGWYAFNSKGGPQPVALKDPNQFGLYDMHGNAAEWCWDFDHIPAAIEIENPRGPLRGDRRIVRGGSWNDPARACRAAARPSLTPGATPDRKVGFRPVLPAAKP